MTETRLAPHALDAEDFPLRVDFLDADQQVVHTIDVLGPGELRIPSLIRQFDPVSVRVTTSHGVVTRKPPPADLARR